MDVRRFTTETKAAVVNFLNEHLNSEDFEDLWANVGGGVDVTTVRPGWKIEDKLSKPCVLIEKSNGETDFSTVAEAQSIKEGYWKDMFLIVHSCCDEATGGKITVDDLSSSVEVIFSRHASQLEELGVLVWEMTDAAEQDEDAEYQNSSTVRVRVLVPGAEIQPMRIELGRINLTTAGYGEFYAGTTLSTPQPIELELINSTSASNAVVHVTARDKDDQLVSLTFDVPRATISGTVVTVSGGDPSVKYTQITAMTVERGQAGYIFAMYNKIGV